MKDFQTLSKLGEGAFSCVFKVKRLSDGIEYALKKVKMNMLTEKEKENALNEVRILASINNPYIIAYKEAFFDESTNSLCVIMEYANGGDIQKKISEKLASKGLFTELEIWKALLQMVKGLKTLHDMQILHRDLKCANIFLTMTGDIKLGDLNVSKVAKKGLVYTQTGTPYYASPEVWRDQPYDGKSDIWSLGCVIYEMAALKPPFRATDMKGLYNKVQKGLYDRIPIKFSNDLSTVISKCLQVNPNARPTCDQLINEVSAFASANHEQEAPKEDRKALLQTIKLPRNLKLLQGQLPKANYQKKPANEMENLYSPSQEIPLRQRVLSAGPRRVDSEQDMKKPAEKPKLAPDSASNKVLIKRPSDIAIGGNYNKPPNLVVYQKSPGNPLPPKPMNNYNQPMKPPIVANNNNNNRMSPMNANNNNNGNININPYAYNRDGRPLSKGNGNNSSRENSKEKLQKAEQLRLEEKLAVKEKNLIGGGQKNIFSAANDELLQKYNNIVNAPPINKQPPPSNPSTKQNDIKKYYEEKKVEAPKIINSRDFPTPVVKSTPKSSKNSENMAAGQYLQGGRVNKPSWWG